METTLLTVGLVCLVAGIVGGGLKILGNELPVLQSAKRQVALCLVGVVLVGIALRGEFTGPSDKDAQASASGQASQEAKAEAAPSPSAASNLTPAQTAAEIAPDGGFRNQTQEAQYLLIALGYNVSAPDGLEGLMTTASLAAFQAQHNLPKSGTADAATMEVLRAKARKAFLMLRNGVPTHYQKQWLPEAKPGE